MKPLLLDLFEDLRAKRLWPVAALLAIALVAVPLLLLKPATEEPATPPDAAAAGDAKRAQGALVEAVDTEPSENSDLKVFKSKDPFHSPGAKRKPGAGTATLVTPQAAKPETAAPTAGGGAPTGGGSTGGGSTGKQSPSSPAPAPTPPPVATKPKTTRYTYVVDVTFGKNGHLRRYRGLRRLSMLPNEESPLLISLGVDAKAANAVFIVDASVKAEGEGRCLPSGPACSLLYLGAGSEELFTQADGDSYVLRIDAIRKVTLARAVKASRARARRAKRSGQASVSKRLIPPILNDLEIVATSAEGGSRPAGQGR